MNVPAQMLFGEDSVSAQFVVRYGGTKIVC